jgi:hypothetical protein
MLLETTKLRDGLREIEFVSEENNGILGVDLKEEFNVVRTSIY